MQLVKRVALNFNAVPWNLITTVVNKEQHGFKTIPLDVSYAALVKRHF